MGISKLDAVDRKILAELQNDGRITNVDLAGKVGISAPPCLRRVRTLEEKGFINGYHAEVNSRDLGFEVQVFAMVGLHSQAETDLASFEAQCLNWPLVRECHMLNGEIDFISGGTSSNSTPSLLITDEILVAESIALKYAKYCTPLSKSKSMI